MGTNPFGFLSYLIRHVYIIIILMQKKNCQVSNFANRVAGTNSVHPRIISWININNGRLGKWLMEYGHANILRCDHHGQKFGPKIFQVKLFSFIPKLREGLIKAVCVRGF